MEIITMKINYYILVIKKDSDLYRRRCRITQISEDGKYLVYSEGLEQEEWLEATDVEKSKLHLSTKIGHKTKKIRHKKRIDVQDSSTFLTSFKLVRQTMPSIMQTRSADGRVTFPILLRRQVA